MNKNKLNILSKSNTCCISGESKNLHTANITANKIPLDDNDSFPLDYSFNYILLSQKYYELFTKYLISVDSHSGKILISHLLSKKELDNFGISLNKKILVNDFDIDHLALLENRNRAFYRKFYTDYLIHKQEVMVFNNPKIKDPKIETHSIPFFLSNMEKLKQFLFTYWGGCAVTNKKEIDDLEVCHISNNCFTGTKDSVFNYLILNKDIAKLFNKNIISFCRKTGQILISSVLTNDKIKELNISFSNFIEKDLFIKKSYIQEHNDLFYSRFYESFVDKGLQIQTE